MYHRQGPGSQLCKSKYICPVLCEHMILHDDMALKDTDQDLKKQ